MTSTQASFAEGSAAAPAGAGSAGAPGGTGAPSAEVPSAEARAPSAPDGRGHGGGGQGSPIRVGLLGCGTVGGGVLRLLLENARRLEGRVGAPIAVKRVLVRDIDKPRVPECDPGLLTTDAEQILGDPEVDLVVEVMGGLDPAKDLVERALSTGKGVVTANKMLLARHGADLLELAARRRVDLAFEGAVGGGIPIIRTLRDAFASDRVLRVTAILNGTCNYILTRMTEGGIALAEALREAQEQGYAEADPSLDIDGHDAAHKLVVLAMLAFGAQVGDERVHVEGIRGVEEADIRVAARFGYVLKHLAIGRDHGDTIELRVHPALIPRKSVLANVSGAQNAVLLEGRAVGPCLVSGRGAGDMPTAVSVVADILDVARAIRAGSSGLLAGSVAVGARAELPIDAITTRYYLRFTVADRPKVMARLAGALGEAGVSIEQIVQEKNAGEGGAAEVVMITHRAAESDVRAALAALAREDFVIAGPRLFRIEEGG